MKLSSYNFAPGSEWRNGELCSDGNGRCNFFERPAATIIALAQFFVTLRMSIVRAECRLQRTLRSRVGVKSGIAASISSPLRGGACTSNQVCSIE